MHYTIYGKVTLQGDIGRLGLHEALFVRAYDGESLPAGFTERLGDPSSLLAEADLETLSALPLAREPMGPEGYFQIDIDDRQHFYQGGALMVVLEVPYLPPMQSLEAAHPVAYLLLNFLQPSWDQPQTGQRALTCTLSIPQAQWSMCMDHFEVHCLAGTLVAHETQLPLHPGLVTAYERQQILGQSETDAQGAFEIWYRGPWVQEDTYLMVRVGTQESRFELVSKAASALPVGQCLQLEVRPADLNSDIYTRDSEVSHGFPPLSSLADKAAHPSVVTPSSVGRDDKPTKSSATGTAELSFWISSSHQMQFYPN